MAEFPSKGTSLWAETGSAPSYASLEHDLEIDVAVIGGGLAGLTTAYLLKQQGKHVAVFEKNTIASGVSGYTTGKITSQHGLSYASFVKKFGESDARSYGEANQAAIKKIETIITKEKIDCDWRREDSYVFTEKASDTKKFRHEAEVAKKLGLPAEFVTTTALPFAISGAVKFSDQATFHIAKYLQGLANAVEGGGSRIFEHSHAEVIQSGMPTHFRANGHTVIAGDVVLATNVPSPLISHTAYAALVYPSRSYIVAGKVSAPLEGMYINATHPSRSLLPSRIDGEDWLLVGGDGHTVGLGGPASVHYEHLANYAHERFAMNDIRYKWSTWDYIAYDHMPLVGRLWPWSRHVYVATGLRKWGLTNGTVAAMILADTIIGQKSPWAHTFRSNRLSAVTSLPKGMLQGIFQ